MIEPGESATARWHAVERICGALLDCDAAERDAKLDAACAGDPELRAEVVSLLSRQAAASGFLEAPAMIVAAAQLAEGRADRLEGRRVGPYLVTDWLGSGGMGDVYRARDERLDRDVALKILPDLFADDAERMARVTSEARTLAALNHPNIAGIYGIEESGDLRALVLELVEGSTLDALLAHGRMSVDDACAVARQIAEALEAAHDAGIVHHDLKPSNIVVRPDGAVKLLDFGLATALHPGASPAAAAPSPLGTPAYASPEQIHGKRTDKRSDIWAFGAVLFEMLAGRRVFAGESTTALIAAVLQDDVDWALLPASMPSAVRRLLARCLDRDVRRRLRDIGEARIVLESPADTPTETPRDIARVRGAWRFGLLGAGAAAVVALTAWAIAGAGRTNGAPPTVVRFTHVVPDGQSIALPAPRHVVAVSPDGLSMAYVVSSGLHVRAMADPGTRIIRGTEMWGAVTNPLFSPDGQTMAFWTPIDRTIKRIPAAGGEAVSIAAADDPYGMSWTGDAIVFGQGSRGIMRVRVDGGTPEPLIRVDAHEEAHGPHLLPDGQHLLFTLATGTSPDRWDQAQVVVQSLTSGQRTVLVRGGSDARYVPTGHIIYGRSSTGFGSATIFGVAFDARRLEVAGTAAPLVESVRTATGRVTGGFQFDVSAGGTLVYLTGSNVGPEWGRQQLVTADRSGRFEPLPLEPGRHRAVRVSPDGTRIAIESDAGDGSDLFIYHFSRPGTLQRITFQGRNRYPVWSGDGRRLAFQSDRAGSEAIYVQAADGTGLAERVTSPGKGESHTPESWSRDGRTLLISITTAAARSLASLSLDDRRLTPFRDVGSSIPPNARFSPDGRWVAYNSADRGGTSAIYVEPFPPTGAKYQLFVPGPPGHAHKPVWSPDGRELVYVPRLGGFEAVRVATRPSFSFGRVEPVPRSFNPGAPAVRALFDIAPQGGFVGLKPIGDSGAIYSAPEVQVVLNWLEDVKRLAPPR